MGLSSLFVPLLYHRLLDLSRGFYIFFRPPDFITTLALLVASRLLSPLDTDIIPHPEADFNRQNTQIRDKIFMQLFTKKCLTKWLGHGIIEISGATLVGARSLYHIMGDLSIGNLYKKARPALYAEAKTGRGNYNLQLLWLFGEPPPKSKSF